MNIQAEFTEKEVEILMEMLLEKKYHLHRMAASSNISISAIAWQRHREVNEIARKLRLATEE